MRTAISHLKSTSCYSQSKHVPIPKPKDRSFEEHEKAIWRERIHCDADGNVFIPPNCFKSAIMAASNYRQRKIPGAGNATFTKHFKSGLICMTPMLLGIKKDQVEGEELFLHGNPSTKAGSRVWKTYPLIPSWEGHFECLIVDDIVDDEIYLEVLRDVGRFIGLGRFRPAVGGFYGRFEVLSTVWA